jgi:phosphoribosyl 1,2-cyclic phosphate phosphodiesterase
MALRCLRQLPPQTLILTHISHRLDCWLMQQADSLSQNVVVAYDGLSIVPAQENEPGA